MTEPTRTPRAGDDRIAALQEEAKRLAATYDPYGSYYPDIDRCVRRLRELAGSDVELLTAATPPLRKGEAEAPEWAALLNLARLESARPVDPRPARLDALEAAVEELRLNTLEVSINEMRLEVAQLFEEANELAEAIKRRSQS